MVGFFAKEVPLLMISETGGDYSTRAREAVHAGSDDGWFPPPLKSPVRRIILSRPERLISGDSILVLVMNFSVSAYQGPNQVYEPVEQVGITGVDG